jgi:retron-type reverse transcriptase
MRKAYDSVDRDTLFEIIKNRRGGELNTYIAELINRLHRHSVILLGKEKCNCEMGVPQGSILSHRMFNIYLEAA